MHYPQMLQTALQKEGFMIIRNSSNLFKFFLILITLLGFLVIWIVTWRSTGQNIAGEFYLHPKNINFNKHIPDLELELYSSRRVMFKVKQINNTPKNSINPYFPVILIEANVKVDGWIHMVYTDASDHDNLKWKTFIDFDPKWTNYPFYSYSQYFYDAPLWTYSLLSKPLSFWRGYAFAVKADHKKKSINCIGGIKWGFELSNFKLRPKTLRPKLLKQNEWGQAWQMLQEKLPGYTQTYGGNL